MIPPIQPEPIEKRKEEERSLKLGCFFCGRTVKQEKESVTSCNRLREPQVFRFTEEKKSRDMVKHDWQEMPPK